jgi:hypothetical protein
MIVSRYHDPVRLTGYQVLNLIDGKEAPERIQPRFKEAAMPFQPARRTLQRVWHQHHPGHSLAHGTQF